MRILIVDDRLDGRLLLETALKSNGYSGVASVGSAEEAYRLLGIGSGEKTTPFDLILLDIMMPGINGIEACRAIKSAARLKDVPIIMVTAQGTSERLQEAFAVGA